MQLRDLIRGAGNRVGRSLSAWPAYKFHAPEVAPISAAEALELGYNSQSGQDVLLDRHVFAGRRDGVFVDVGAHDGVLLSNSWFFERERGWTGLCVEPNPDVHAQLVENRSCEKVNAAVADTEGTMPFRVLSGHAEMLSGLESTCHPRHARRIERELRDEGGTSRTVQMQVRRLDSLLREHGITHVDLLNVDVEGAELGVLSSLSLAEFSVDAVLVENQFRAWKIARLMQRQGYQLLCRISSDEIYVPRGVAAGFVPDAVALTRSRR